MGLTVIAQKIVLAAMTEEGYLLLGIAGLGAGADAVADHAGATDGRGAPLARVLLLEGIPLAEGQASPTVATDISLLQGELKVRYF
jgi:hypothetical protein